MTVKPGVYRHYCRGTLVRIVGECDHKRPKVEGKLFSVVERHVVYEVPGLPYLQSRLKDEFTSNTIHEGQLVPRFAWVGETFADSTP